MPYIMLINDSPNFTLININYNLEKATAINHLITKQCLLIEALLNVGRIRSFTSQFEECAYD